MIWYIYFITTLYYFALVWIMDRTEAQITERLKRIEKLLKEKNL